MADAIKGATVEETRKLMEESISTADAEDIAALSDDEILEIERLYRLSAPIRVPLDKLDPNYDYRWVNKNPKVYRRRRGVGWKPVSKEKLEELSLVPIEDLHMGTHFEPGSEYLELGDTLIFCYIPKRITEAIKTARRRKNEERLNAGKRRFHDSGRLSGVETFEKSS